MINEYLNDGPLIFIFYFLCVRRSARDDVCWCYSIEKCTWTDFFPRRMPAQQLKHVSACTHTHTRIIIVFDEFVFSFFVYCIVNSISILVALKHVIVWRNKSHNNTECCEYYGKQAQVAMFLQKNNFHLFRTTHVHLWRVWDFFFLSLALNSDRSIWESNGRESKFCWFIYFLLDSNSFHTPEVENVACDVSFQIKQNLFFFLSFCLSRRDYVIFARMLIDDLKFTAFLNRFNFQTLEFHWMWWHRFLSIVVTPVFYVSGNTEIISNDFIATLLLLFHV